MTVEEFSNEFDTLANSYSSQEPQGFSLSLLDFDEYEKSVYLTKALEEVVEGLYTGKILGDAFEGTELLRRYLSNLVNTAVLPCKKAPKGISDTSIFAVLPPDVWFITYESAVLNSSTPCIDGKEVQVIPVTLDEYNRIKGNPFRRPNSRRVLRLDVGNSMVELLSDTDIRSYLIRYVSRPEPIILLDLPEELSINKVNVKTECKLNPSIHRMILEVAVGMAVKSRIPSIGK